MKALTIWQPWASLIMVGAKPFEFRTWDYAERYPGLVGQRIVIHAGKRPVKQREVVDLLKRLGGGQDQTGLIEQAARPLLERIAAAHKCRGVVEEGAGLGTVVLGRARNAGTIFGRKVEDSDRGTFNMAWPLTDIQPWSEPVFVGGLQGFWDWQGTVEPVSSLMAG